MEEKFTPFEGKGNYAFISYARGDLEQVLRVTRRLYDMKYRLWYDEGISAGAVWPAYIEDHLRRSSAVLFFISAKTSVSPNCFSEIKTAFELGRPVICITLDDCARLLADAVSSGQTELLNEENRKYTDLTAEYAERRKSRDLRNLPQASDWLKIIGNGTFVDFYSDAEGTQKAIHDTKILDDSFIGEYPTDLRTGRTGKNRWIALLVLSFLLLAGTAGGVWALMNGYFPKLYSIKTEVTVPDETVPSATPAQKYDIPIITDSVSFPDTDTIQEKAVRLAVGIDEGDIPTDALKEITELNICGSLITDNNAVIFYENGKWYVNGSPVIQGKISDLSLIGSMYYLESLSLIYQDIGSLNPLSNLPLLTYLNLSGNPLTFSKNAVTGFLSLQELNISHTGITDLTPLIGLKALKKVYVSADMFPLQLDPDAQYEVILIN